MSSLSNDARATAAKWELLRGHAERIAAPRIDHVERELLVALKLFGDLTVPALSEAISSSPAAVRQHLRQLEREHLVHYWTAPSRTNGRPPRVYSLTDRAHALFPSFSPAVGRTILEYLSETDPEALERVLRGELNESVRRAIALHGGSAGLDTGVSRSQAPRFLQKAVSQWGYLPQVIEHGEDIELVLHHCPFLAVVEVVPGFCNLERDAFQVSMPASTPRRIAHRFSGDRVCAYFLKFSTEPVPGEAP